MVPLFITTLQFIMNFLILYSFQEINPNTT